MTHISERELELPDAIIGKLLGIAAERKDIISLGPGEPDFPTPKPIVEYLKKNMQKGMHYSDPRGRQDLRKVIAKKLRKENKIKSANEEDIIVTTGSQEGLLDAFMATLDPGEQIVLQNPGYLAYIPQIELINAYPVYLKLDEEDGFEINPDKLAKLVDKKKTKVILINTPANPTGNVLSKKVLEEVADIAVENDVLVFSDEAYEKLVYGKKHISFASLNGMEKYAVTFHTFSKSFAMTGFRVGYVHGPQKLINPIAKVHHYTTLCAPHISQIAALKALHLSGKYIERMRKEYDKRRKFIVKRLNETGLKTCEPFGAFYAFSNITSVTKKKSFAFAQELLRKAKVATVPGTEFGSYGEGFIRFSYATDLKRINDAMDRIERYLNK